MSDGMPENPLMNGEVFRKARNYLRLSRHDLARHMMIKNKRTIERWETGEKDIFGPAALLMSAWLKFPELRPPPTHPDLLRPEQFEV